MVATAPLFVPWAFRVSEEEPTVHHTAREDVRKVVEILILSAMALGARAGNRLWAIHPKKESRLMK
jgi:hypothetical protein